MKYRALLLLITVALISAFLSLNLHSQKPPRTYVGSAACGDCHVPIYQRWAKTRMANVVTDPRARPQVVIPDFSKADPLLTFKLDDVALVYGTKWKQRYFKKVGDDYFPLSAQWDVNHKIWRPYFVQPNTDWWVPYYPADNMKRPPDRYAMAAIRSITISIRRPSPSGMSAASGVTDQAVITRGIQAG